MPTIRNPILLLAAFALTGAAPAPAAAASAAAKVNGTVIPQYRVDAAVRDRVEQGQPDSPALRKGIREALINQEIVAQAAVKEGLNKQPEVAARIELERQSALVNAYFEDHFRKHPITEAKLREEYERIKPALPAKEYRARHILVDSEDEAKQIIAAIKKGASFEKLAAEKSKDPGSKNHGGELPWAPPTNYVKEFGAALAKLKKGEMTQTPVHTSFGWHVIRVEDERPAKVPGFEEMKPQLQQLVQQRVVREELASLRAKAKIE